MTAFEVGQTLFRVSRGGDLLSWRCEDSMYPPLPAYATALEAWEAFHADHVLPQLAYARREYQLAQQLDAKCFVRIAELRAGTEAMAARRERGQLVGDGSFQGGTDADREAL